MFEIYDLTIPNIIGTLCIYTVILYNIGVLKINGKTYRSETEVITKYYSQEFNCKEDYKDNVKKNLETLLDYIKSKYNTFEDNSLVNQILIRNYVSNITIKVSENMPEINCSSLTTCVCSTDFNCVNDRLIICGVPSLFYGGNKVRYVMCVQLTQ